MEPGVVVAQLAKPILTALLKACAKAGTKAAANFLLQPESSIAQQELDAKIENLFGNPFNQQLLDIQKFIEKTFSCVQTELNEIILTQSVLSQYRTMLERLHNVQDKLDQVLKYPDSISARNKFLFGCKMAEPGAVVGWLYKRCAISDVGTTLVEDIVQLCGKDLKKYETWQQHILLTVMQACNIHAAYAYFDLLTNRSENLTAVEEFLLMRTPAIPVEVKEDFRILWQRTQKIVKELYSGYLKVRSNFVFRKCGSIKHEDCGAMSDQYCCELGAKTYKFLCDNGDKPETENANLASQLAIILRQDYPQFDWAVLIVKDHQEQSLRLDYDPEHLSNFWIQTMGTKSFGLFNQTKKEGHRLSEGLICGQFLCYRHRRNSRRAALLFWEEPERVESMKDLCSELNSWMSTPVPNSDTSRSVLLPWPFYRTSQDPNMSFSFKAMAVEKNPTKSSVGIDLVNRNGYSFPVYFESSRGCHIIVWPLSDKTSKQIVSTPNKPF